MPKSDTPATRRSARVAAASAGPASKLEEHVKLTEQASAAATGNGSAKASTKTTEVVEKKASKGSASKNSKASKSSKAEKDEEKDKEEKPKAVTSRGVLKLGQTLPRITLEDNTGEEVDVSSLAGERGVVLFLYPRADTPGCTNQACGFRHKHDEIAELGYDIYGLSKDKPANQQKWINKKDLNFRLLCDPQSQLIKKLGAFVQPNNTNRSHFIFEKGTGKLIDIAFRVKPADDPSNVLKFLKAHHKDS